MPTKKAKKKVTTSERISAPVSELIPAVTPTRAANEPSLEPPDSDGFGVWSSNKKIVQTWGKAQNKNAWLNISGIGWRRIKETSESAMLAILLIGAHARDKNSNVNVRTESDNKIYELYVW